MVDEKLLQLRKQHELKKDKIRAIGFNKKIILKNKFRRPENGIYLHRNVASQSR